MNLGHWIIIVMGVVFIAVGTFIVVIGASSDCSECPKIRYQKGATGFTVDESGKVRFVEDGKYVEGFSK